MGLHPDTELALRVVDEEAPYTAVRPGPGDGTGIGIAVDNRVGAVNAGAKSVVDVFQDRRPGVEDPVGHYGLPAGIVIHIVKDLHPDRIGAAQGPVAVYAIGVARKERGIEDEVKDPGGVFKGKFGRIVSRHNMPNISGIGKCIRGGIHAAAVLALYADLVLLYPRLAVGGGHREPVPVPVRTVLNHGPARRRAKDRRGVIDIDVFDGGGGGRKVPHIVPHPDIHRTGHGGRRRHRKEIGIRRAGPGLPARAGGRGTNVAVVGIIVEGIRTGAEIPAQRIRGSRVSGSGRGDRGIIGQERRIKSQLDSAAAKVRLEPGLAAAVGIPRAAARSDFDRVAGRNYRRGLVLNHVDGIGNGGIYAVSSLHLKFQGYHPAAGIQKIVLYQRDMGSFAKRILYVHNKGIGGICEVRFQNGGRGKNRGNAIPRRVNRLRLPNADLIKYVIRIFKPRHREGNGISETPLGDFRLVRRKGRQLVPIHGLRDQTGVAGAHRRPVITPEIYIF